MNPTQTKPRLVKLVRDRIGQFLGDSVVSYEQVPRSDLPELLRAKLIEECVEYLLDPSAGELADILEVLHGLAVHDLRVDFCDVEDEMEAKLAERGGFQDGVGMYVQTTASARHEGRHAA